MKLERELYKTYKLMSTMSVSEKLGIAGGVVLAAEGGARMLTNNAYPIAGVVGMSSLVAHAVTNPFLIQRYNETILTLNDDIHDVMSMKSYLMQTDEGEDIVIDLMYIRNFEFFFKFRASDTSRKRKLLASKCKALRDKILAFLKIHRTEHKK